MVKHGGGIMLWVNLSTAVTGTDQNYGMGECVPIQRGFRRKPAPECMQPETGATVHLSA